MQLHVVVLPQREPLWTELLPNGGVGARDARMDMLDEACRIIRSLWTQETTTFVGKHYRLEDARLEPKPLQERLPVVIGARVSAARCESSPSTATSGTCSTVTLTITGTCSMC
jgi:alkanesulfonate monooxygenase SsuD/methylene tetrahydromethanopterin reductase-like flavin-dependent oxidoreductase (luciferase family)